MLQKNLFISGADLDRFSPFHSVSRKHCEMFHGRHLVRVTQNTRKRYFHSGVIYTFLVGACSRTLYSHYRRAMVFGARDMGKWSPFFLDLRLRRLKKIISLCNITSLGTLSDLTAHTDQHKILSYFVVSAF